MTGAEDRRVRVGVPYRSLLEEKVGRKPERHMGGVEAAGGEKAGGGNRG